MKFRVFVAGICCSVLCGCTGVQTSIEIANQSGNDVLVKSGQTGKSVAIPRDQTGSLAHTLGPVEITAIGRGEWRYPEVSVADHPGVTQRTKTVRAWRLQLKLVLMTNGTLVAAGGGKLSIPPQ